MSLTHSRSIWPRWSSFRRLAAICLGWWFVLGLNAQSLPTSPKEYEIKAAFLFRIAQFMEWPTNRFRSISEPISLSVLGKDPFGEALENVLANQKIGERSIVIQRQADAVALTNLHCHILFISASAVETEKIVANFRTSATVTVGEGEDFTRKGGHVRLYLHENRLRFEINIAAFERSGLKLHSQVMKLAARITRDGKDVKQ